MTSKKASTASIPGIWQRTLPTLGEVPASLMVVMMFFVAGLSAFAGGNVPVASSMSITVLEDLPVTIPLQAIDNEGDPLTYSIVSQPDAKSGVLSGTGANLTFIPVNNFNGDATFTFKVNDGTSDSEVATVYIEVLSVNDAPILNGFVVSGKEDERMSLSESLFSAQYSDLEGDPFDSLTVTTLPKTGVLKWDGTPVFAGQIIPANLLDQLIYDPAKDDNGVRSFTVRGSDGLSLSTLTTVTVVIAAVDDLPIALAQSVTLTEDMAQGITLVGSDVEKAPLTYTVVQPPTKGVLSGSGSARTYTPNPKEHGSDRFTYKMTASGQDSETVTVALSIISVNDAPRFQIPKSTNVVGDNTTPVVVSDFVVNAVEDTFTSVEGFATQISSGPANESLQTVKLVLNVILNPELFAIAPAISADGTLTFTPASDANGTAKVEVYAQDDGGTADGGVDQSPVQTFLVTVAAVNDPPVAGSQVVSATEDTEQVITLRGFDAEGALLTYKIVKAPLKGTLIASIGDQVTYRPGANETGVDKFTFRVSDGISESSETTVRVVINPVNDAPVVRDVSAVTADRAPVKLELVGTDVDSDRLSYSIVSAPNHGRLTGSGSDLVYLSEWGFSGTDRFTFKANDGSTDSSVGTVTIQVTPVNQAPIAGAFSAVTDEDTAVSLTLMGVDLEGSDLTYMVVRQPSRGVLLGEGAIRQYVPNLDFNGTDSFTFKVSDGELDSGLATVTIRVNPINDAPIAGAFSVVTDEDKVLPLTLMGLDSEGSSLSYTVMRQPIHGTLIGEGNRREYIPNRDFNASDSFTYKVSDGQLESGQVTVTIRVNPINDAPIAGAFSAVTDEDTTVSLTLMGVDLEGSALTYKVVRPPVSGTLIGEGNRRDYIPKPDFHGTDSFTYRVNDGELDSGQVTVSIRVNPVQDAPVALAQSVKVTQGSSVPVTLVGFDADQNALNYKVVSQPKQGTLSGSGANWIYQSTDDAVGSDTFTYRVNDGFADSGLVSVRINIGEKSTLGVKSFNGSSITLEVRAPIGAVVQVENATTFGVWSPTAINVTGNGQDMAVPVTVPIDEAAPARFWRLKVLSTP